MSVTRAPGAIRMTASARERDGRGRGHSRAGAYGRNRRTSAEPDQIATPELAVDRKVEVDEVSRITVKFQPGPDRPDLLHFQSWLLTGQLAGIQTARPCSS
jgi:hypothetical protein